MIRSLLLAGASAMVLSMGGGGLALAAGNSTQGATGQQNWSGAKMEHSQAAAGSHQTMSRDEIMQAQRKLQSDGLYNGKIDGMAGPETQQALKQFQQKNKLQQTGQLDEQTEAKLGINEAMQGSGSSQPPSGMSGNSMKSPAQNSNSMKSPTTQNK